MLLKAALTGRLSLNLAPCSSGRYTPTPRTESSSRGTAEPAEPKKKEESTFFLENIFPVPETLKELPSRLWLAPAFSSRPASRRFTSAKLAGFQ
ncbi:MAG: hypothetical protein A2049_05270 [Elusimicrobia bacterium GWA2_62_23]|nr:MAG: hypothetical protein A2049_05270 [Elusimicrobia bacterium GWA2_62_23]OGR68283.1 MAG: hypothetical protein A2179_01875 [Elusimicrobia bacterium GWC2_63_65]